MHCLLVETTPFDRSACGPKDPLTLTRFQGDSREALQSDFGRLDTRSSSGLGRGPKVSQQGAG